MTRRPVLKCDECHTEVQVERITRHLVGLPCPECCAPMLTPEDYRAWKRVKAWMFVSKILARLFPAATRYSVKVRGGRLELDEL
jgi:hypothetical protein